MCEHSICDQFMWPLYASRMCEHYVWALYVWARCVGILCEHEHRKVRELPGKMDIISSWAGCSRTPKSTRITTQTGLQFLGPMLQNTEKYENDHENSTSVLGPDVAAPKTLKSTSFIVKTLFKSIAEHRKVRELPRKTNIEEVEEPKKHENLQTKHRRHTKSTRITTKNEHRRSWRAGNYENLQTKAAHAGRGHPETTKIHRRNAHASTKPPK